MDVSKAIMAAVDGDTGLKVGRQCKVVELHKRKLYNAVVVTPHEDDGPMEREGAVRVARYGAELVVDVHDGTAWRPLGDNGRYG